MRRHLALCSFVSLLTSACDQAKNPVSIDQAEAAQPDAATLLKEGDAKICIDPDIKNTVVQAAIQDDPASVEFYRKSLEQGRSVKFSSVSLVDFDEKTSTATCRAQFGFGQTEYFFGKRLSSLLGTYTIRPTVDQPGAFYVEDDQVASTVIAFLVMASKPKATTASPTAPSPAPLEERDDGFVENIQLDPTLVGPTDATSPDDSSVADALESIQAESAH